MNHFLLFIQSGMLYAVFQLGSIEGGITCYLFLGSRHDLLSSRVECHAALPWKPAPVTCFDGGKHISIRPPTRLFQKWYCIPYCLVPGKLLGPCSSEMKSDILSPPASLANSTLPTDPLQKHYATTTSPGQSRSTNPRCRLPYPRAVHSIRQHSHPPQARRYHH
jgi:hypothetical protein